MEVREHEPVGVHLVEVLEAEPLPREPRTERRRAGVREHAARCRLETGLGRQRARLRAGEQRSVRRGAPQEERQSGGQIDVTQVVAPARTRAVRRFLEPEHEVGTREDRLQGGADPVLEPLVGRAFVVERHERRPVLVGERTAKRLRPEAGHDLLGARPLLRGGRGPAVEDLATTRRVRDPRRAVGALDHEILQMRQGRYPVAADADLPIGERPLVRGQEVFNRSLGLPQEGRRYPVRTGPHKDGLGLHVHAIGV